MDLKEKGQILLAEEMEHWWVLSRFSYLSKAILKYIPKQSQSGIKVLEVGSGTGQNLHLLRRNPDLSSRIREVVGYDIEYTDEKVPLLASGDSDYLVNSLAPVASDKFHLLVAMDVIEHIPDEKAEISKWSQNLRKDGYFFVAVPALPALWSYHDEFLGHQRRYTKTSLDKLMVSLGYKRVFLTYGFSHVLLPAFLQRRILGRIKRRRKMSDIKRTGPIINFFLILFGKLECYLGGNPFFGTSVYGLYQKTQN